MHLSLNITAHNGEGLRYSLPPIRRAAVPLGQTLPTDALEENLMLRAPPSS